MLASVSDDFTVRIWGPSEKYRNCSHSPGNLNGTIASFFKWSQMSTTDRLLELILFFFVLFFAGNSGEGSSNGSAWHDMVS